MAAFGVVIVASTAQKPVGTSVRSEGIDSRVCGEFFMPVPDPFPDVAMHIVEAPGIREFFTNGMCIVSAVTAIPAGGIEIGAIIKSSSCNGTCEIGGARSRAAGMLPFGFGGKAVAVGIPVDPGIQQINLA